MRCLTYILLLFILCSYREPDHVRAIEKLMSSYSKQVKKQWGLSLAGRGGAMMYDVKEVTLAYNCIANVTLEEARKLFVDLKEGFVDLVNGDVTVRPYLHNYPFLPSNFDCSIIFVGKNGLFHTGNQITCISCVNERIHYRGYDPVKDMLYDIHAEPYEEAVRLVRGQAPNIVVNSSNFEGL